MKGIFVFLAAIAFVCATTIEVTTAGPDLWNTINNAQPGDEIVVRAGDYPTNSGGSYYVLLDMQGTSTNPIVVKAYDGETVRILGDQGASQNVLNIRGTYFVFKGFEIMYGSHGIRLQNTVTNAVFEGLNVHNTGDVGISANIPGAIFNNVTFRRNEVSHTSGTGECFYIGCNNNDCSFRNGLFEGNYCHHTLPSEGVSQGDGIEIKTGSYGNVVRDNVIHDVNYPGIIVYDAASFGASNVIERNVIWNSGDNAIQITAGTIARNNIIINAAGSGIAIQGNQGTPSDVTLLHNTVYGAGSSCFYASWGTASGFVVANNAFYCQGGTAISVASNPNAVVTSNVVVGGVNGAGTQINGNGDSDFGNPTNKDFFPSANSALNGAGDNTHTVDDDFNGTPRDQTTVTVGAYQEAASNPGWSIQPGFKDEVPDNGDNSSAAHIAVGIVVAVVALF